jgi:hypothetical protein
MRKMVNGLAPNGESDKKETLERRAFGRLHLYEWKILIGGK